jgi:hypothetical protein
VATRSITFSAERLTPSNRCSCRSDSKVMDWPDHQDYLADAGRACTCGDVSCIPEVLVQNQVHFTCLRRASLKTEHEGNWRACTRIFHIVQLQLQSPSRVRRFTGNNEAQTISRYIGAWSNQGRSSSNIRPAASRRLVQHVC